MQDFVLLSLAPSEKVINDEFPLEIAQIGLTLCFPSVYRNFAKLPVGVVCATYMQFKGRGASNMYANWCLFLLSLLVCISDDFSISVINVCHFGGEMNCAILFVVCSVDDSLDISTRYSMCDPTTRRIVEFRSN